MGNTEGIDFCIDKVCYHGSLTAWEIPDACTRTLIGKYDLFRTRSPEADYASDGLQWGRGKDDRDQGG